MDGAVLIERDMELGRLTRVVDGAIDRRGTSAVVEGEPGSGKSSIVQALAATTRRRGVRVVVGHAAPRGAPFDPIVDLLADLAGEDAATILEHAAPIAERDTTGDLAPSSRLLLIDGVLEAIESSAADGPVVVLFEDIHWSAESTLAALGALARRVGQLGIGLVVTTQPGPWPAAADALLRGLATAGADMIRLPPLSPDGVSRVVAQETGRAPGPRLVSRLCGAAGNPLLVVEYVRSASASGAMYIEGDYVELVESASALCIELPLGIAARLPGLSAAANEVLHAAAVLGPCTIESLCPVLECAPAVVRRSVDEATAAGFLDGSSDVVQFRHELLAESFRARVPSASQAAMHRQVGRHLAAASARPSLVAHHLERGSPTPDAETIFWLRRAAVDAAAVDPDAAATLLGRALAAMSVDDPGRGAAMAERARALLSAGRLSEARDCLCEALSRSPDAASRAELRAVLAEVYLLRGRPGVAVAEIGEALAAGGHDELQHARLRAQAATMRLWAFDLPGALTDAESALQLGARLADPIATSRALSVCSRVAAFRLDLDEAIQAGREAVERAGAAAAAVRGAPHLYLGLALLNGDRWDEARHVLQEGAARCEALGAAWALPRYQGALAILSFFSGEWDEALAAAETARLVAEDVGHHSGQGQIEAIVGLIAHHRGDRALAIAAARRSADAMSVPGGDGAGLPYLRWLEALLAESRGESAAAVDGLRQVCALALQLGVPLVAMWLAPDLSRLAIAAGHVDVAEWIAVEIAALAPRAGTVTAHAVARLCGSAVGHDEDGLLEAATAFEEAGRPYFAARGYDAAAGVALRERRHDVAVTAMRRAVRLYDAIGAAHDARVGRRQLRALGARSGAPGPRRRRAPVGWECLTPTERSVAQLVSEGLANGEIASRLFVSKRTIETHLSRVYAKLQVSTRVAIANIGRDAAEPVPA